jgi:hypothetical protein
LDACVGRCYKGTEFTQSIEPDGLRFMLAPGVEQATRDVISFPLPTPVIVAGPRSRLLRVFVLYELGGDQTALGPVIVRDGPNPPGTCDLRGPVPDFTATIRGPVDFSGRNCLGDLIDDKTRFNYQEIKPEVFFGLVLVVNIRIAAGGFVRFTSVGADYEIV